MPSESSVAAKQSAAQAAARLVKENTTVALGSGSTSLLAIAALGARFPTGGGLRVVASSRESEYGARKAGLTLVRLQDVDRFQIMIDGADEVAPDLSLIKGGGGAHFREKLLARMTDELVIMVDPSKLVRRLGERFPVPLEVVPFAVPFVARELKERRMPATLRMGVTDGAPFVTDNANHVLDARLPEEVEDLHELEDELRGIPGVVETGLFLNMTHRVLVGFPDGRVQELRPGAAPRPSFFGGREERPPIPTPPRRPAVAQ